MKTEFMGFVNTEVITNSEEKNISLLERMRGRWQLGSENLERACKDNSLETFAIKERDMGQ